MDQSNSVSLHLIQSKSRLFSIKFSESHRSNYKVHNWKSTGSFTVWLLCWWSPSCKLNSSSFSIAFPSPPCRWFIAMALLGWSATELPECWWTFLMQCIDPPELKTKLGSWMSCKDWKKKKNATNLLICCSYLITLKMTGDGDVFFSVNTSQ